MSIFSQSAMSNFSQWKTCNVRHTLTRDPEIAPDTRCFCRPHFFVRPRHIHWVAKFSSKFTLSPLIVKTFWSKCSVKIIFQTEMRVTARRSCVVFEAQNTDKEILKALIRSQFIVYPASKTCRKCDTSRCKLGSPG